MAKQVFDLRGSAGISSGQSTEHLRNYKVTDPDMKKYGFYDPTRERLNFEVGRGGVIKPVNKEYSINKRFADILRSRGIIDPNKKKRRDGKESNRRTMANIILGGSRDQMLKMAFGDQTVDLKKGADNRGLRRQEDIEKWAQNMYRFIAHKFGEENIVAFVVHLDEKNPHVHCSVIPVVDNKISYRKVFVGDSNSKTEARAIWKSLHDEAALVNAKWNLQRGDDINTTGARHKTSEEYWLELRAKCNALEQESQDKQAVIDTLNKELKKADIAYKGLTTMLNNFAAKKENLEAEIESLQEELEQKEGNDFALELQLAKKVKEMEDLDKKILEKKASLNEYINRREQLINDIVKLKQEQLDLIRKNEATKDDLKRNTLARDVQVTNELGLTGYNEMASQLKELDRVLDGWSRTLTPDVKESFEKVWDSAAGGIMNLAEKCNEAIAVAAALYFEDIQAAGMIAAQCGGGGGGGKGWGRRKDEDDDDFRRRCFLMGSMMMRPAGRKLKR